MPHTLANTPGTDLLWFIAPVLLILSAVVTFEVAMGLTISTLPRSRAQMQWTPHEQRRVVRLFLSVFLFWPALVGAFLAYLFLPTYAMVLAWAFALCTLAFAVRNIARAMSHKRRVLAGHCSHCLYDLRGSLDREHCPECGVVIAHHPAVRKHRRAASPRL